MFSKTGKYVKNINKLPVEPRQGHNDKLLDVIMPGNREGVIQKVIQDVGAKGGRAFTVTFTDHFLNKYKESYLEFKVNKITARTKGVLEYCFASEYSDAGRFHLHGVVLCTDLPSLSNVRRKLARFGIVKVKVIDDSVKWSIYCTKQMLLGVSIGPPEHQVKRK